MRHRDITSRRGFTIAELLIGMVIAGIVGTAMLRLILSQSQFYQVQDAVMEARTASLASFNVILSDLRMVEVDGGVVSASSSQVTVRVPYAFGIICAANASTSVVSLLPVDSVMYTNPGFSGYAWRASATGAYNYIEGGVSIGTPPAGTCAAQSITTLSGGQEIALSPGVAAADVGDPVFLFRRVQYSFASSAAVPGRTGLWRTFVTSGTTEELVAPFQATAGFGFFVLNADTAQSAVPALLGNIRGLELRLNAASTASVRGQSGPQKFDVTTAVFFRNRLN